MADINKLKDKIKSTIYPNGKGAINASDHQAMLLDMAEGMAKTDTKLATLESETNSKIAELSKDYAELSEVDTQYDAVTDAQFIPVNILGTGYLYNGEINPSSSSWYSDFIPVDADKLYRIVISKSRYDQNVAFYSDADFNSYISSSLDEEIDKTTVDKIISVPSHANYMVVSSRSQKLFNVQSLNKHRAASNIVEQSIELLASYVEDVSSNIMKRTNNIFNVYTDMVQSVQIYKKQDGTLQDSVDNKFCYYIKISPAIAGKYYNFRAFYDDEFSLGDITLCIADRIESGNKVQVGTSSVINKKGYILAEKNSDLFLYVQFPFNSDSITHANDRLRIIIDSLVVTESTQQVYPSSYIPYREVGLSLQREIVDDSTINVFLINSKDEVLGNKVQIKLGASTPSQDVVDSNYLNSIKNISYKLGNNDISEAIVKGAGWSGNLREGYTHIKGQTETLEFDLSQYSVGEKFILRFNCSGITSESSDILISVGNAPSVKTYNGTSSFTLGFIATGGNLILTPQSGFASTITNISICKISEDGDEEITLEVDNVYAQVNNFITAFWNVAIGAKDDTLNKLVNGSRNIAIGNYALKTMVSGNRNVGIGTFAMPFLTEAENNVAIGADTIYPLKKAKNCVGIGKATLGGSQSAEDCVAIGAGAMGAYALNKDRFKCVAIGVSSGNSIVDSCTHVGYRAGANVAGARNTSIGYNSLAVGNRQTVDITGTDLTCVGSMAQIANTDEAKAAINSTAIGANTTITKSNQVVIGNSQVEEIVLGGKRIIFNADGTCRWENA